MKTSFSWSLVLAILIHTSRSDAFSHLSENNVIGRRSIFAQNDVKNNNRNTQVQSLDASPSPHQQINDGKIYSKKNQSRREWVITHTSYASAAVAALTARPEISFASPSPSLMLAENAMATMSVPGTFPDILCDPAVSIFQHPSKNRVVYLLGTAHISSKSAEASAQLVRDIKPKAVFVELDAKRVGRAIPKPDPEANDHANSGDSVTDSNNEVNSQAPSSSTNNLVQPLAAATVTATDESPKMSKPKFYDFREMALRKGSEVVGNSIKGLYSKLESEGFNAGEEFVFAVREGLKINAKIILGDRDVEVTLRRLTEALAKTDLKKLLAADSELEENMKQLLPQDLNSKDQNSDNMSTEQLKYFVETVKAKDNVRLLMNNLKAVAPEVYQAMVAERDVFMANGLDGLDQFESIVAVMGIAHVDGVENTLRSRGWKEMKPTCP